MSNKQKSSGLKLVNYLKDVRREAKQIVWPTFNFAFFQFIVVILLSAFITVSLYSIDLILAFGIDKLKAFIK
ncbi:MAG TPA: preprotein translocase subunit SecE [Vampirovibrionales bacterium]